MSIRSAAARLSACGVVLPVLAFVTLIFVAVASAEQAKPAAPGAKPAAPAAAQAAAAKFKAIWEPVNIKEDLSLTSVHFVSEDEGWVAGGANSMAGGVILHTSNGGMTWETQLGDSTSDDRGYDHLRFIDAKTGFAVQSTAAGAHRLFGTTDGKTWSPIGVVEQDRTDYRFVSPTVGFVSAGNDILRTSDGGKKWASVYVCQVKAEVDGLTRDIPCEVSALHFVDASNGFGVTRDLGGGAGVAFVKTSDGGAKWTASVILPGENGHEAAVHFVNPTNGVVRMQNGRVFQTADGGRTWSGAVGEIDGRPNFSFADSQVGWAAKYQRVLYTRDGGRSWLSSATKFPTAIDDSSLPARDRGYVVGEHGMVYRYRIVPVDFEAKGILPAPSIAGAAK
jgi:photosystem II stability/assembly factor-like uncharacterized protein